MDLHHPNPAANDVDGEIGGFGDGADACGPVNVDSVQQVIAAKWAVDVINNQSLPHELKIGKNERELFPIRVAFALDWIDKLLSGLGRAQCNVPRRVACLWHAARRGGRVANRALMKCGRRQGM